MKRRKFFSNLGLGLTALGISENKILNHSDVQNTNAEGSSPNKIQIKKFNSLGTNQIKVSDIIFGGASFASPDVARFAYDLGINMFDTAESYMNGRSEEYIGKALKGIRDKTYIISKHWNGNTSPNPGASKQVIIDRVNASLKRLNTDYIDILLIHNCSSASIINHQDLREGYAQLKKQGKVRFTGISTHTAEKMLNSCLFPEVREFVQVIMFMYNHMEGKKIEPLISQVSDRGIGTICMKSQAGGKQGLLKNRPDRQTSYPQAAIAWVMANPNIDCTVISMNSFAHVEEYTGASGKHLRRGDLKILTRYSNKVKNTYCRVTCSSCETACPEKIAISDIMRYKMYFEDYGHEKSAIEYYARLNNKKKPESCLSCTGYCNHACPYGLDVKNNLREAHRLLSV